MKNVFIATLCLGLAACAGAPRKPVVPAPVVILAPPPAVAGGCGGSPYAPAEEDITKRGDYVAGGLYRPGERDRTPLSIPDVACIPEPQVVDLPRSKLGNRPVYTVLDREYRVLDDTRGFAEEGLASYYGEKFHGRRTSNWEVYDMYAFSAAHKTLPLPSFARVTNLDNGRSVVVRVNDRGPFHDGRVMDLSLAAAVKLGVYPRGTGRVRVEALQPGETGWQAGHVPPSAPVPAGSTVAAQTPVNAAAAADYRFEVRSGRAATNADHFDGWMKQQGVRVATGQPTPVTSTAPASITDAVATQVVPLPPVASTVPAALSPAAGWPDDSVLLQVASFSTRDNADRALARLHEAGIDQARLLGVQVAGQPVWRLRIGPLPTADEPGLIARLAGLGFATARRVRE
ncbi:MAG: septal ring lytic transglycosylase RlpA family protein [Lysobacter sp.]|nr:MAG: septal ring lytic transglycosylase RlpA family protein [Lysobacter sp.]